MTATATLFGQISSALGIAKSESPSTSNRSLGSSSRSDKKGESSNGSSLGYAVTSSRSGNRDFDFDFSG